MARIYSEMEGIVNSDASNQSKAESALLESSGFSKAKNIETASNIATYYQHLADQEWEANQATIAYERNKEQADIAYERSKAGNQVQLLMNAGMTRQAALATLNQGGAAAAATSPAGTAAGSFSPSTSAPSTYSETMQNIASGVEMVGGLIGSVGQMVSLPSQFKSLQLLQKQAERTSKLYDYEDKISNAFINWRSNYPNEYKEGEQMSIDEARRLSRQKKSKFAVYDNAKDGDKLTPLSNDEMKLYYDDSDDIYEKPGLRRLMKIFDDDVDSSLKYEALGRVWQMQYDTKGVNTTERERDAALDALRSTQRIQQYKEIQEQLPALKAYFASRAFQLFNGVNVSFNSDSNLVSIYDRQSDMVDYINNAGGFDFERIVTDGKVDPLKINSFTRQTIDNMMVEFNAAEMSSDPDAINKVREKYFYDLDTQVALALVRSTISTEQSDMILDSPNFQTYLSWTNMMDLFHGFKPIEIGSDLIGDIVGGVGNIYKQIQKSKPRTTKSKAVVTDSKGRVRKTESISVNY